MANCHVCKVELKPAFEGSKVQFDNALEVIFGGGYGMFIDPEATSAYLLYLCHECAHDLCDKVPWIKELIQPHTSHSHLQEYRDTHPDHYGWDYDHHAKAAQGHD